MKLSIPYNSKYLLNQGRKTILNFSFYITSGIFFLLMPNLSPAQSYALLIKGGHVIDVKNNIDEVMDIAISEGKIAKVSVNISSSLAAKVIVAKGLYVTPGFIDITSILTTFMGQIPYQNTVMALML